MIVPLVTVHIIHVCELCTRQEGLTAAHVELSEGGGVSGQYSTVYQYKNVFAQPMTCCEWKKDTLATCKGAGKIIITSFLVKI